MHRILRKEIDAYRVMYLQHAPEKMAKRFLLKSGLLAYGLPLIIVGTTILVTISTDEVVTSDIPRNSTKGMQIAVFWFLVFCAYSTSEAINDCKAS